MEQKHNIGTIYTTSCNNSVKKTEMLKYYVYFVWCTTIIIVVLYMGVYYI